MTDNYWQCTFCVFLNKPKSEICWACLQRKRPAETPKGWQCTRCTLLNEPHLESCLICGSENIGSAFASIGDVEQGQMDSTTNNGEILECVAPSQFVENNADHLIENIELFDCPLCYSECHEGDGIVLKNCNHRFCKNCLTEVIQYSWEPEIKCPFKTRGRVCPCPVSEGEVNELLNRELGTNVSLNPHSSLNGNFDSAIWEQTTNLNGYPDDRNAVQLSYRVLKFDDIRLNEHQNNAAAGRNLYDNVNHPYLLIQKQSQVVKREPRPKVFDYQELVDLEKKVLIPNIETFECTICFVEHGEGEGIVIRDCLHTFCRECLKQAVQFNTEAEMRCPYGDGSNHCESLLQDREIRAIDPEVYEKHLTRSIKEAENKITNTYHCKTVDCTGWCIYEEEVTEFYCPVCSKTNCINCKVIHTGLNCKQYQEKIQREKECNTENAQSETMLEEMVKKKEAMYCPTCKIIVTKMVGCDWLRCLMCKTEICWVTRGPRWGPWGSGDTSGGCRCRLNGKWCHPQCGNCH